MIWCTCQSFASVYLCSVWFCPMLFWIKETFATLVLIFDIFYYGSQLFVHTWVCCNLTVSLGMRWSESRLRVFQHEGIIDQISFCKVFVKPVWCQCLWSCKKKKNSIHSYLHLFCSLSEVCDSNWRHPNHQDREHLLRLEAWKYNIIFFSAGLMWWRTCEIFIALSQ